MRSDAPHRPRLMLAVIVTLIAFPTIWWFSRADDNAATADPASEPAIPAGAGGSGTNESNVINPVEAPTTPPTTEPNGPNLPPVEAPDGDPPFMDGPQIDDDDDIPEIAVPAAPPIEPVRADATFRSTIAGARSCLVRGFGNGATLRITNLDNGRSVTCVATLAPSTQQEGVILHTNAFELLADLTEAPIPVEIQA